MTAGRWTPNIATRGRAKRTKVIFEFQHELANGEWKAPGLARTAADDFDVGAAVRALRVDRGGNFALIED